MRIDAIDENTANISLTLSLAELRIINNCLNETLESFAASGDELATRVGAPAPAIEALLRETHAAVVRMGA